MGDVSGAQFDDCMFLNNHVGILAEGSVSAIVRRTTMRGNNIAIDAGGAARIVLEDCEIE
jgi:hypothetical protein